MRVKVLRDCFVGSFRKAGEEFDHEGPPNRHLQPLKQPAARPSRGSSPQPPQPQSEPSQEGGEEGGEE
ncbi:MAG TPA: hypothetical protein VHB45_12925 [Alloacidobacterium sp.]|nr:hypothetical protein [Alloacidobacterium sp.]